MPQVPSLQAVGGTQPSSELPGGGAETSASTRYDRIAGALKELGHAISDATVGNILRENGVVPAPERKKGTTWADFIVIHKDVLVACDFFTKEVWTLLGPVTYYVLFFMHVANRKVHVAGFTRNPDENWMKQIARNVTMAGGFFDGMKYLILDRDGKFAPSFRATIESAGVELLRLPPRSPNLNAFAERFVRSIKEECLDQLILFGEPSLQRALDNFVEHYNDVSYYLTMLCTEKTESFLSRVCFRGVAHAFANPCNESFCGVCFQSRSAEHPGTVGQRMFPSKGSVFHCGTHCGRRNSKECGSARKVHPAFHANRFIVKTRNVILAA